MMMNKVFKVLDKCFIALGILFIIGAIGKMDYMTLSGQYYSLLDMVKTILIGLVCFIPAVIHVDEEG